MGYPDIERARESQAAIRRIVEAHAGPGANLRALRRTVDLCRELSESVDDDYCREKVRTVLEYAAELLSGGEDRARGALSGAAFLRPHIRRAPGLVQSRTCS